MENCAKDLRGRYTMRKMVASEVYRKLDHMLHYMFPNNCYNEMLIKLNVFDPDCSSLVLSRLLGLAVTAGSLMLFVPQIIKIQVARSGAGISLPSQLLGLLSCFATAAYSYASNFVFSQWGDSLFVAIQMAIIIMQILYFSTFSAYAFAFLAFCWAVTFAVIGNYIPFAVLAALQAVTIPLVVVSKFLQIHANFHDGSTGQLSLISVGLQFGGCIARVFTSVKETGDALVIAFSFFGHLLCKNRTAKAFMLATVTQTLFDISAAQRLRCDQFYAS